MRLPFLRKRSRKQPPCLICGHDRFLPGPYERLCANGKCPRCARCQSLERHRLQRKIAGRIAAEFPLASMSCLQFSADPAIDGSWFGRIETSIYGGANSLDIQAIDRAANSHDLIVINHVLEHVADDARALRELLRILTPDGFVFLSVPDTMMLTETTDWGYPRRDLHGHYRHYGRDFPRRIEASAPDAYWLRVVEIDDSTLVPDEVYLISQSRRTIARLARCTLATNALPGGPAVPA